MSDNDTSLSGNEVGGEEQPVSEVDQLAGLVAGLIAEVAEARERLGFLPPIPAEDRPGHRNLEGSVSGVYRPDDKPNYVNGVPPTEAELCLEYENAYARDGRKMAAVLDLNCE